MALMDRVATLLRANLNDLVDRAENPEKMLKQVVLDMENQLLQVKTQVAISISDEHLLRRKCDKHAEAAEDWNRKAGLAVARSRDDLARHALSRSLTERRAADAMAAQLEDQSTQTETLRSSYLKLQQKLEETRVHCEALRIAHRRAANVGKAKPGATAAGAQAIARYAAQVDARLAQNQGAAFLQASSVEDDLQSLDRDEQVTRLLENLKSQRSLSA